MNTTSEEGSERARDRFRGALVGTMVGDALGMPVEGAPRLAIRQRYGGAPREMLEARLGRGTYTDDTQLMIGLAEALLDAGGALDLDAVARRFAEDFDDRRGYGGNVREILAELRDGAPWRDVVARRRLPGGSFANGAAMRVAPVALAFHGDEAAVAEAARRQGAVTGHDHPLATFGAELVARAVHRAVEAGSAGTGFDLDALVEAVRPDAPLQFELALTWIVEHRDAEPEDAIDALGVGGLASQSVPAALWAFASRPDDAQEAIVRAVGLGGDTDTIGAMAGAIAGAMHGLAALPDEWVDALENGAKGRDHVVALADRLRALGG